MSLNQPLLPEQPCHAQTPASTSFAGKPKGYEPGNCVWATRADQSRNRRFCWRITFGGATRTLAEWAREVGLQEMTLKGRLRRGWPVDKALTTPVRS